jgi:hypothetical protein
VREREIERERETCVVHGESRVGEWESGKTVRMNQASGNGSALLGGT